MERETTHFLEAVAYDRPVLVTADAGAAGDEVYVAADISAERKRARGPCRCPKIAAAVAADLAIHAIDAGDAA